MDLINKVSLLFLLVCASFIPLSKLHPQNFIVRNYNLEEGMQSNVVHDVIQDKDRNMWFATESGVSVYNAKEWKNYSTDEGLPEEEYFYLKLDNDNTIWAVPYSTFKPIAFFKNNIWKLISNPIPDNISGNVFTSFEIIYEAKDRVLCLGTNNGLLLYKRNKWKKLTTKNGLIDNRIYSLCNVNNKLFICTEKGISIYSNGRFDDLKLTSPTKKILAAYISEKDRDVLWLMGNSWLGRYKKHKFELLYKNSRSIFNRSRQRHRFITYDNVERIFCGNEYEMYLFDLKEKKLSQLSQENGFVTSGCSKVFLDCESNLWFTTYRGIDKIGNQRFQNFFKSSGLFENEVTAIIEVNKNHFIFGHNKGITIYRDGNFRTIDLQKYSYDTVINFRIMGFCKDLNNTIWIAASQFGVGKLVNDRIKWIKFQMPTQFNAVATDHNGSVWVGSDDGLFKIENDKLILVGTRKQGFRTIRKLYFNKDNELFAALPFGFIKYSNGNFKEYGEQKLKLASNVYSFCDFDNSSMLLGTKNGLFILQNDSVKLFTSGSFKITKKVFTIERDKKNIFWFGTNDGVIKWDGKENVYYGIENGLTGREINRASVISDLSGNTWIGTDKGLSCYLPNYERNDSICNVIIEKIESSQGVTFVDLNKEVTLPSPVNELVFHFRAVSFVNEAFIEYKVMLNGFDSKWINNGNSNSIRYTNLKPGEYRFSVMARNPTGSWSKIISSGKIIIDKPLYNQWWFFILLAAILIYIIYLVYKYKFQVRYSNQLEKEVEQRTEKLKKYHYELEQSNLAKDKFFSIIAHDLKSPFLGLLGLINILSDKMSELNETEIKEYIGIIKNSTSKLYDLIVQLLEWSRLQTGNIEFNPTNFDFISEVISPSISLLKVNADAKEIKIENKISGQLMVSADVRSFRLVTDNLLSNAIKFTKSGGKITLNNTEYDGYYEISINDNGVGIEPEMIEKLFRVGENISMKGTSGEEGTGLGLILCKEVLEKNGSKISITSQPDKGSTFSFTIMKAII